MTQRTFSVWVVVLFWIFAMAAPAAAQDPVGPPIKLAIGGTPGGALFFTGGDDNTEVNFNVYTFSGYIDYYVNQNVAVEGEYWFGNGWGQDVLFRNGLLMGQQLPFESAFSGGLLFYPQGANGARFPFFVSAGVGRMSLLSRPTTKKVGYDPDVNGSEGFTLTRVGAGVRIPRRVSAPNWAFRIEYRLLLVSSNNDAPAFFAHDKTRTGHQVQLGLEYTFRRQ